MMSKALRNFIRNMHMVLVFFLIHIGQQRADDSGVVK
jgi:hypothetical protein